MNNIEHGIVPPWILFKSIYFSTIINFIDQFKSPERKDMVYHLYDTEVVDFSEAELALLMMDTLFICLEYCNKAVHGGRIYNYECTREIFAMGNQLTL